MFSGDGSRPTGRQTGRQASSERFLLRPLAAAAAVAMVGGKKEAQLLLAGVDDSRMTFASELFSGRRRMVGRSAERRKKEVL